MTTAVIFGFVDIYDLPQLKCVGNFCVPENYDKYKEPFDKNGHMDISVDFDILQIVEVDDVMFSIKFVMDIALTWVDQRIVALANHDPTAWIPVDLDFASNIWLPDSYIYEMKESNIPKYYKPFEGIVIKAIFHTRHPYYEKI